MRRAIEATGATPTYVFAGMRLVKSGLAEAEELAFINALAKELQQFKGTKFYTMHCTGEEQYAKLRSLIGEQIEYLSCGDNVII